MKKIKLPPNFAMRFIWMMLGIAMMGCGVAVLIKLNLGTDPYASFVSGLSGTIQISYGTTQLMIQGVLFIGILLRGRRMIGIGMIANMVLIGYITDWFTIFLDAFVRADAWGNIVVRCVLLLPALAVVILGAALYMAVDLGMSPFDGIPFIIAECIPKVPFRVVRMCWDFLFMIVGALLGGTVGIITILQALFLGPVIAVVRKKLEKYLV